MTESKEIKKESKKTLVKKMIGNNDLKIWGKKVAKQLVIILIAGAASVYSDNPYWLALAPVITAVENWIQHM